MPSIHRTIEPMNKLLLLVFLSMSAICYPQITEYSPTLGKDDLPDIKSVTTRTFTGESLFGYMNGGAELYREYGISKAVITEFDWKKSHFKCEVFKMNGAEEAFGIFSVSKYRCPATPPVAEFSCQTKYHLQICKGPYYISIINSSGVTGDSLFSLKIGEILAGKISEPSADLTLYLPGMNKSEINRNSVLVKGKLGLMNGATAWEDHFKEVTGYYAVFFTSGEKSVLSVRFSSGEKMVEYCRLHKINADKLSVIPLKKPTGEEISLLNEQHILIRSGF